MQKHFLNLPSRTFFRFTDTTHPCDSAIFNIWQYYIRLTCEPNDWWTIAQVPFTLDLPEDLFHGPRKRTKITVHKPIRPGDPEFKDVATLRKHCFDTVMVSSSSTASLPACLPACLPTCLLACPE